MSRLMFLVAMVAASAMFSCGSDGNVSSTDDSSLGDNSVPDNFVPPDNQPDVTPDTAVPDIEKETNIETEEAETKNPCEGYEKYNGKHYQCKDVPDCTLKVAPAPPPYEGECSFQCQIFNVTADKLTFKEDGTMIYHVIDNGKTYDIVCTPTS